MSLLWFPPNDTSPRPGDPGLMEGNRSSLATGTTSQPGVVGSGELTRSRRWSDLEWRICSLPACNEEYFGSHLRLCPRCEREWNLDAMPEHKYERTGDE
jgi:hypothetical protein